MDREQTKKVVYSVVYGAEALYLFAHPFAIKALIGLLELQLAQLAHISAICFLLSVSYFKGKERLAACLGVTVLEATHFLEGFLQKYKKIKDFSQTVIAQCHRAGYVTSILGRRRPLPRICAQDQKLRAQAERQAVNFVVQGSAADLCKLAMIRIFAAVATSPTLTARLVAQIHDELLFEVEDTQIPEFAGAPKGEFECRPLMGTPGPTVGDPGLSLSHSKSPCNSLSTTQENIINFLLLAEKGSP
ncbi:hypothetical protein A6R68_00650 [Neotoma lepida]|uniref:DNA-directed DNA polymerase family A palm domain-containing protein n=1 Tax=Neotoma lepida TaxID=56216 RepID=A0A1A6GZ05_NEOLE|nr:hypothetical protein A6R68_00650 [Neotoma lepida]